MMGSWMEKDPLTDKDRAAVHLVNEGLSSEQIVRQLFLSAGTVCNYLSFASSTLQAKNRIDSARIAHQNGWL